MSDAYDPRQEFPGGNIILGGIILVVLGFATVGYIIWGNSGDAAAPSGDMAPAE